MREIQIVILLPIVALLAVLAFQQYMQSFGAPAEQDMSEQLFPVKF